MLEIPPPCRSFLAPSGVLDRLCAEFFVRVFAVKPASFCIILLCVVASQTQCVPYMCALERALRLRVRPSPLWLL